MDYTTVYETSKSKEIPILEKLLEENEFDFRVFKGAKNDSVPETIKIQVADHQKERATYLLFDKGFKRKPPITQEEKPKSKFWIFLLLTIVVIIIIGFLVNWFRG